MLALLAISAPRFFEGRPLADFAVRNAPVLVAAVGMTLVILARQIDISVGSQASVCAVVAGLLAKSGMPMPMVGPGDVAGGRGDGGDQRRPRGGIGPAVDRRDVGDLGDRPRVAPYGLEGAFVRGLPPNFQWFGAGQATGRWLVVGIAAGVFVAFAWGMRYLSAGRSVYATGSDPEAARLAGIRPRWVVFSTFVAMGALTGLYALLNVVQFPAVDPKTGTGLEMQVIAAVVVGGTAVSGGRGTMIGTLIGVLLLGTINPALVYLHTSAEWEKAIQGGIILLAVASDGLGRRRA